MIKVDNIGNETIQRHVILFEESEIILTLRFLPMVSIWVFDVEYKGKKRSGFKLAVDTFHILSSNYPFDFIVIDNSGEGLDPFNVNDFATSRCSLFMLEAIDIEAIRGQAIEV